MVRYNHSFDYCWEHQMKQFLLKQLLVKEDVDFLNQCKIPFDFTDKWDNNDTGWCDASTGARILTERDCILFSPETKEDEITLLLKFGERIKEFTAES